MNRHWNPDTYDAPRRRLVPCYQDFYGTVRELISRTVSARPRMLDLGAGTGLLSAEVIRRITPGSLTLQDVSAPMLAEAARRLRQFSPRLVNLDITTDFASGTYDVIMSALAIHHLVDEDKRRVLTRAFEHLAPGGVFINAEQVSHPDEEGQHLYESMHLDHARALGSDEDEIAAARKRMEIDRCSPADLQLDWMRSAGFTRVSVYYQWFRFAVMAGWKRTAADHWMNQSHLQ